MKTHRLEQKFETLNLCLIRYYIDSTSVFFYMIIVLIFEAFG